MENKLIVDAENSVLGRMASLVAKAALMGKEVIVVNAEKTIVSGKKQDIAAKYIILRKKGGSSQKGPIHTASSERIVKRTIRGMLEHKKGKGREAFKRIRCYDKIPEELKNMDKVKIGKQSEELNSHHWSYLKEIVKLIK